MLRYHVRKDLLAFGTRLGHRFISAGFWYEIKGTEVEAMKSSRSMWANGVRAHRRRKEERCILKKHGHYLPARPNVDVLKGDGNGIVLDSAAGTNYACVRCSLAGMKIITVELSYRP